MILILFLLYLICLIIYIIKGIEPLKNKLLNIIEEKEEKKDTKQKNDNTIKKNALVITNNINIYENRYSNNNPNKKPILKVQSSIFNRNRGKIGTFNKKNYSFANTQNTRGIRKFKSNKIKRDINQVQPNLENNEKIKNKYTQLSKKKI